MKTPHSIVVLTEDFCCGCLFWKPNRGSLAYFSDQASLYCLYVLDFEWDFPYEVSCLFSSVVSFCFIRFMVLGFW